MMTTKILRDWDLRDLIVEVEKAYEALEDVLLSDDKDIPDRLREVEDDVLGTLAWAADFLLELRGERHREVSIQTAAAFEELRRSARGKKGKRRTP